MKLFTLLTLLLFSSQLFAQGWIWESGEPNHSKSLESVLNDSDSSVTALGDSAYNIIWKRLDHQGNLLDSRLINTPLQSGAATTFIKKDFGFAWLNRNTNYTSWTTFNSFNFYKLLDVAGNALADGFVVGHNGNDYVINDAVPTPDSAVLLIGSHLNPDENKLYIQKAFPDNQNPGNWAKDLHDSTKKIMGLRIYPVSGNRYLVLAKRSGVVGTTSIADFGFLLINDTGDLLEANWVPGSGNLADYYSQIENLSIDRDAQGFTILDYDSYYRYYLYRFDSLGHLVWSKADLNLALTPLSLRHTPDGYVVCGYQYDNGLQKMAITALDVSGNLLWSHKYNLHVGEQWKDVTPLAEGGFIAVGFTIPTISTYNRNLIAVKLNADGSIFNNLVTGYVFADMNGNCLRDSGEIGLTNLNTYISNGIFPYSSLTDSSGHFEFVADTGNYSLKFSRPPGAYWTTCVDSLTGYFQDFHTSDTVNFPFRPTALCPQLSVYLEGSRIRPCSTATAYLQWLNTGTIAADSAYIRLTLSANTELLSANLPLTDLGNDQYELFVGNVPVGASGHASVVIKGDCGLQIGDYVCLEAHIFPDSICATPEPLDSSAFKFSQESCLEVRNSYDPNEKTAEPLGRGPLNYLPADTTITYLVRFQNTGNDTAFTVVVRDTLSANLDPFSVQPEIASHPYRLEFQQDGSLKFIFEHILLPDSTTNESASHGFVRFQVRMRPGLQPLTPILNQAAIYFDYNAPVLTNTVLRTIQPPPVSATDVPAKDFPVIQISPNPGHTVFELLIMLKTASNLAINVYDVNGRKMAEGLPNSHFAVGEHQVFIPAEKWPAGIYFIEIRNEKQIVTRKLVKQ